ncbi:hypothetical protein [Cellulophaga lytica]
MITIAVIVNLIATWTRNMREFSLVGAWALIAIGIANKGVEGTLVYVAYFAAAVLLLSSFLHAFKNRKTAPFIKLKEYLSK